MKKYILFISLFCYIFCQAETTEKNDTIIIIKDGVAIDISDLKEELKNMKYDFQFNKSEARNMQRHWDSVGVAIAKEATKYALMHNGKNFRPNRTERTFTYNSQQQRQPSRIENRTFQDISNIEFSHKYGDIIVQESKSNRVELEIHYFDRQSQKASVVITEKNNLLTITTDRTSKGNSSTKINYIISIPRNTGLSINIKYGNVKMGKHDGNFKIDMSYTNLKALALTKQNPDIKAKYSDVIIDEVKNVNIVGSYANHKIKKASVITLSGNYNDCVFDDAETITIASPSSYGDLKVGTVGSIAGDLKYTDINIDKLLSVLNMTTAYGDITIKSTSDKLKAINIKASYADIDLSIPANLAVTFDVKASYGDLKVAKKYAVKYTESQETHTAIVKKGQIGSGKPTANITIANSYADINIK